MTLDLGRVLSRSFAISWRHRWLWLLGVFGGGGLGSFNFRSSGPGRTPDNVTRFLNDHAVLVAVVVLLLLAIILVAAILACIAVPACIWAGLQLDAGHEVGLRTAWREGRRRGWRYFRLALLRGLAGMAVVLAVGLFVLLGVGLYAAMGTASIPLLVIGGLLVVLAFVAVVILLSLGLTWADRMLVLLGVGAADSMRASWWLFRHNKADTFILGLVVGVINFGLGLAVLLAAGVVAIPGIVMLGIYFSAAGGPSVLAVLGAAWILVVGGAVLVAGGGYLGSLTQVAYALAARDLALQGGLQVLHDVIGFDPGGAGPTPAPA